MHLDNFAERELLFEPGTRYSPSSYGWLLVSAAVEAAANEPFFAFMRTQVFEPLGMRDTTVDVATDAIPARAAFYYPRFGLVADTRYGPKPARVGDHSCYAGGAAFLSTPSDLVRFGMSIRAQGGTLLKPATVQLLQTPQRLASGEGDQLRPGLGGSRHIRLPANPRGCQAMAAKGISSPPPPPPPPPNTSFADTKSIALGIAQAFAERLRP